MTDRTKTILIRRQPGESITDYALRVLNPFDRMIATVDQVSEDAENQKFYRPPVRVKPGK